MSPSSLRVNNLLELSSLFTQSIHWPVSHQSLSIPNLQWVVGHHSQSLMHPYISHEMAKDKWDIWSGLSPQVTKYGYRGCSCDSWTPHFCLQLPGTKSFFYFLTAPSPALSLLTRQRMCLYLFLIRPRHPLWTASPLQDDEDAFCGYRWTQVSSSSLMFPG